MMPIEQILFNLFFAAIGAYLSIVLSRLLRQNGRVLSKLDEGFRKMDEGFRKMDEGFKLIARLIVEENEKTRREILEALKS
ncbi:MAG: hypothetical protein ACOYU0_04265 [Nitrospirota bacterium]